MKKIRKRCLGDGGGQGIMKLINFHLFSLLFLLLFQNFKVKIKFLFNYKSTFNISKAFSWTMRF
jgi:hypothetical protein